MPLTGAAESGVSLFLATIQRSGGGVMLRGRACAGCIVGMGDQVNRTAYSHTQRRQYRHKIQQCLDVFETMLAQSSFECEPPLTGMEIEGNLIGEDYRPAMSNAGVLSSIDDPAFQRELGSYNIEFNVPPRQLTALSALDLEAEVRASLNDARPKPAHTTRASS